MSSKLSNNLLGRIIRPQEGLGHVWLAAFPAHQGRPPLHANATIVAAWTITDQGQSSVMVAAHDDNGVVGEFYLRHVTIDPAAE